MDPHKDVNFAMKAVFKDSFTHEKVILRKLFLRHVMWLNMNYAVPYLTHIFVILDSVSFAPKPFKFFERSSIFGKNCQRLFVGGHDYFEKKGVPDDKISYSLLFRN